MGEMAKHVGYVLARGDGEWDGSLVARGKDDDEVSSLDVGVIVTNRAGS